MQTTSLFGLHKVLHPEKNKQTTTERILNNLGKSNISLNKNDASTASGIDSFDITENISELLSPACGMTDEEKSEYLNSIMAKLKSGKKLSAEEMRFLQDQNPVLYQQVARVQAMRDSLKTRMEHATSKKDVQEIYTQAISSVSDKDPMKEYVVAAYNDVKKEYEKTDAYQSLPDDDEDE